MSKDIPFFALFSALQARSDLRVQLAEAVVSGAAIDQEKRSIRLRMTVRAPLSGQTLDAVKGASWRAPRTFP